MLHWHSRAVARVVTLLLFALIAPSFARGEEQVVRPGGIGRDYAARVKQLQVHLLQRGSRKVKERAEAARRAKRALHAKGPQAAAKPALRAKLPKDHLEADGPQGASAPATLRDRQAVPSTLQALLPNVRANSLSGDAPDAGQSEASIAAWGSYVLVGWNDGEGFISAPDLLGYGYSVNGGTSFTDGGAPPKRPTWRWTSDPVVAVNDKTGEFYFCGLVDTSAVVSGPPVVNAVAVVRATFSGSSIVWGTPRIVRGTSYSTGFIDKPWIAADSLTGNVYVTYTFFGANGDTIDFHRSTTAGSTWSNPIKLSSNADNGRVQGSRPAVGPNGEVYATWFAIGTDATFRDYFRMRRSADFGATFAGEATVAGFYSNFPSGAPGFNREFAISYPSIAVDRTRGRAHSGRVYVAWNEGINFYDDDLGTLTTVSEVEANDTPATANAGAIGQSFTGNVSASNDLDYFAIAGVAGQTLIAYADSVASGLDMSMRLFCSDGTTRLAFSAPGVGRNNLIAFTFPTTGTYYLRTASFSGTGYYSIATGLNGPVTERARDHRDVFAARSDDGITWATPVRISDSPTGFDDWLPEVAVSGHGRPYGMWFDWRDAPAGTCGGVSHIYLSRSDDDGATWTSLGATSDAQTPWTSVMSNIAPNQGDYVHLFANGTALIPVWGDGRGGSPDVYTVTLPLAITPTQVSLASAVADPDRVTLVWASGGGDFTATVQRRIEGGDWADLAVVLPDGSGRLTYEDRAVLAGTRYAYRLRVPLAEGTVFTPEAWIDVPTGARFALSGARPNPASRAVTIAFSLPDAVPATLALFDLNGRALRSMPIAGAGEHLVNLGEGITLEPGIYLVRLTREGRTLTTRVSVVR